MYRSAQEPGNYVSSEMLVLDKSFYTGDFKSTVTEGYMQERVILFTLKS